MTDEQLRTLVVGLCLSQLFVQHCVKLPGGLTNVDATLVSKMSNLLFTDGLGDWLETSQRLADFILKGRPDGE